MKSPSNSRDLLLFKIKTKGPQTAINLAKQLELTPVAVRQHLEQLEEAGLVKFTEQRQSIGRPSRVWELTTDGHARFPDSHADLTVDLLHSMRTAFGETALDKLVEARTSDLIKRYRSRLAKHKELPKRVAALAELRTEEGYMSGTTRNRDGSYTLVENHCPICAAAELCRGLCAGELKLFSNILGRGVTVEREEHILAGSRRCSYKITPKRASSKTKPSKG